MSQGYLDKNHFRNYKRSFQNLEVETCCGGSMKSQVDTERRWAHKHRGQAEKEADSGHDKLKGCVGSGVFLFVFNFLFS